LYSGRDYLGHITGMGMVIPNVDIDIGPPGVPDVGIDFHGDVLIWIAHVALDTDFISDLDTDWWEFDICGGLIQVINGNLNGAYLKGYDSDNIDFSCYPTWEVGLLNGTWCSSMASTPFIAIPERFIEPDSDTVKQVDASTDLAITKTVDNDTAEVAEVVEFTIIVTNNGPGEATGVLVDDLLPDDLIYDGHSASQGSYSYMGGIWTVGSIVAGSSAILVIEAIVDTEDQVTNEACITDMDQADPVSDNDCDSATINSLGQLDAGWNLISLPLIPPNDAITLVLADILGANLLAVWSYEWNGVTEEWFWYPGPLTTMTDGKGYWVNLIAPDTLTFAGVVIKPAPAVPPEYHVYLGWNLVGFKSTTPRTAGDYLAGLGDEVVTIYGYKDGAFFLVQMGDLMEPGYGYWIATVDEGTIYP